MEHKLAVYLEQKIGDSKNRTELDAAKMTYGLEIILNNFMKLLIIMLIGACMGVFLETFCVFLGFGILRMYAGGVHCDTNKMCWISSIIVCVGNAYLAQYSLVSEVCGIVIAVVCVIIIELYAPSGTRVNPIKECDRSIRKRNSLVIVLVYAFIAIIGWKMAFARVLLYGTLTEAVTLLPIANCKYNVNQNIVA